MILGDRKPYYYPFNGLGGLGSGDQGWTADPGDFGLSLTGGQSLRPPPGVATTPSPYQNVLGVSQASGGPGIADTAAGFVNNIFGRLFNPQPSVVVQQSGMPTWALPVGAIAVIGLVAYFALGKKKVTA